MMKATKRRPRPTYRTAASIRQLAHAIGRPSSTLDEWRRLPEWPTSADPPWTKEDVARIAAWVDARDEARHKPRDEERAARLKVLEERAKKLRLERQILEGKFVNKEEEEERDLAKVYETRARLRNLEHALVADLAGKPVGEFAGIIRDAVQNCLLGFADATPLPPEPPCQRCGFAVSTDTNAAPAPRKS
jgi:hypothetical protein